MCGGQRTAACASGRAGQAHPSSWLEEDAVELAFGVKSVSWEGVEAEAVAASCDETVQHAEAVGAVH
eukprot:3108570-Amphidinium_carterae.1